MAVWPAGGIGLSALLLNPRRLWPAIVLALFAAGNAANFIQHRPVINSFGFMIANMAESLGCAWVITRICGNNVKFDRVIEVLALTLGATAVNAASACIGAGVAMLTSTASYGHLWLTWWIVDGLGILIMTPLVVTWSSLDISGLMRNKQWTRLIEGALFIVCWGVLSGLPFNSGLFFRNSFVFPYMLVALLAWPALRFGQRGVTLAIMLLAVIAITSLAVISGPLVWGGGSEEARLVLTQLYLGFSAVSGMLLAASFAESRQAQRKMAESLDFLETRFGAYPIAIFTYKSSGQVVSVNDAAVRLVGATREQVMKQNFRELESWKRSGMLAAAEKALATGEEQIFEGHTVSSYGHDFWISCRFASFFYAGDLHLMLLGADVSERKKIDEKIRLLNLELEQRVEERTREVVRQNEKLQEMFAELTHMSRVAVLGQLTAALAHEINQPLGTILNRASSAKMILSQEKPDTAKLQEILSSIIDEDERAGNVIRRLRSLIKKELPATEAVDLGRVVEEVTALVRNRSVLEEATLSVHRSPASMLVMGNRVQLQQVLLNLITNALEAVNGVTGSKIVVRLEARPAGKATVSVSNSGPAIEMKNVEQLFQPFYTTKKEGLGVGLFICRSIIHAHGGLISASNDVVDGATFYFTLPLVEENAV